MVQVVLIIQSVVTLALALAQDDSIGRRLLQWSAPSDPLIGQKQVECEGTFSLA